MGCFSWLTSDTKRSIASTNSDRPTFPVYMRTEAGRVWVEEEYDGYGVFGGKDIFVLIAELNGLETRSDGIVLVHKDNDSGDFCAAAIRDVKLPKLFEFGSSKFAEYPYPLNCPYQGYFY